MDAQRAAHTALISRVSGAGGVARVTSLVAEGYSRHRVTRALEGGALVRVRRDWVALPAADEELIRAAKWGVALSCISEARRLGLWVLAEERAHVAAAPHSWGVKPEGAVVHWSQPLVPRHPDALVDPIENVLALVAACQPREAALAVIDSALNKALVSAERLRALPISSRLIALLHAASPYADSGLETLFGARLRWLGVRILSQIWIHDHRVDFLIGDRLVVQVDGGHHVGPQRTSDIAHDAELTLLGYHVIRLGYAQVVGDWPFVQDLVMRAVAQGLHRVPRVT